MENQQHYPRLLRYVVEISWKLDVVPCSTSAISWADLARYVRKIGVQVNSKKEKKMGAELILNYHLMYF